MSLMSALTAGEKTKIRANKYQAQQFVCLVPNTVVVQFQPSVAPSTDIYAEIVVGTVASGSMSNISAGQLVIYSDTSDYYETEKYRTYVRKVSGTSTLYVGQNGQSLSTSQYVTVIDTYEVFERPRVERSGTEYADWEIAFRRLLPVESALPTVEVLTRGTTAYSPTASPQAVDNDATSSFTHAWASSNSNDTLDSGGTTNNPSFTLEAGAFRWIRYTFTDSNGNSSYRVIAVWTVPTDYSNAVSLGFIGEDGAVANITCDPELGWSGDVPAHADITDILPGTFGCVWSEEWYNDTYGSIRTNIDLVGYLQREETGTRGDPNFGRVGETRFTIDGFGVVASRTPVSSLAINSTSSPSAWGDIENPTPVRMALYILTEHTTLTNLCAVSFFSDHTDFIGSSDVFFSEDDVTLDAINAQIDTVNAVAQWDTDGKLEFIRKLTYLDDTARDAAATVDAITPDDVLDYTLEYEPTKRVRLLTMTGGVFTSSSGDYDLYRAYAPPLVDLRGTELPEIVNQVLTTDSSLADAKTELGQRAANAYAALNPTYLIRATLKDEWRFLVPDVGVWYTFDIATTDTIRGKTFTSSQRWQLTEISYTSNTVSGRRAVNAVFRLETQDTGAIIDVAAIENDPDADTNPFPAILPPFAGGDLGLLDDWFDTLDVLDNSEPEPPDEGCEAIGLRIKNSNGTQTTQPALNGEEVAVLVRGSGRLSGGWCRTWLSGGGNTPNLTLIEAEGQSTCDPVTGVFADDHYEGAFQCDSPGQSVYAVAVRITVADDANITNVILEYDTNDQSANNIATIWDDGHNVLTTTPTNSGTLSLGYTPGGNAYLDFQVRCYRDSPGGQTCNLNRITIKGTGINPFGSTNCEGASPVYGDAFYTWSDGSPPASYGAGDGLLIEGSQPSGIPPYNENHEYIIPPFTVNSGPVTFDFESPSDIDDAENWSISGTICFLGVP